MEADGTSGSKFQDFDEVPVQHAATASLPKMRQLDNPLELDFESVWL